MTPAQQQLALNMDLSLRHVHSPTRSIGKSFYAFSFDQPYRAMHFESGRHRAALRGEAIEKDLSIGWCTVRVVAAILGLGLGEASVATSIAASSRVLGCTIATALSAPVAGAATCSVCA